MARKAGQQAGYTVSADRKQRLMNVYAQLVFSFLCGLKPASHCIYENGWRAEAIPYPECYAILKLSSL